MEYTLNLVAERSVVRESLKGIVWSIFFQRLFGPITPSTNEFFGVPYGVVSDLPELDSLIDEKINELIKREFDTYTFETKYGQARILFYDRKVKKKKSSWFGTTEENEETALWETWIINVKCLPVSSKPQEEFGTSVASFETNLARIMDIVDANKDHIPPITSLEKAPFPYVIDVLRATDDTWGDYIRKIFD